MKSVAYPAREEREKRLSCHMYCEPAFNRTSEFPLVRRAHAAIEKHDWRKNEYAIESRIASNQRLAIRSEARMTMKAVAKAIVYYCCYRRGDNQFEVWADIPYLAKKIGAMYLVNDQRVRYDTVYNALSQFERMGALMLARDYDKSTKRFKKSRIFVMPSFFRMFGLTDKEVAKLIAGNQKHFDKQDSDIKSKMSALWGRNKLAESTKATIRGLANKRRLEWMRIKYKALNDEVNAPLVREITNPGVQTQRPAANDIPERVRLRANLSKAEEWMLEVAISRANPTLTPDQVQEAIDNKLRERRPLKN